MAIYKNTMEDLNKENIIYWDSKAQSIVAVPMTNTLNNTLKVLQPVANNSAKNHIEKTKKSENIEAASWKDEYAVKTLINLWKENESFLKSSKVRNDVVWRQIAAELQNKNPKWIYTGTQCENKFKDVRKNYVKVKDHNINSTGRERKTCKFYEDMEEVLGDKPCIKPVAIGSSLLKRPSSQLSGSSALIFDEDEIQEVGATPRKRGRIEKSLQEWATTMRQDSENREKIKERRHKERLEKQGEAITAYKEMMSELLKKL